MFSRKESPSCWDIYEERNPLNSSFHSRKLEQNLSASNEVNSRIFLIRHAESQANVQREVHHRLPDYTIPLTENGKDQARQAGEFLKAELMKMHIPERSCHIISSPYKRARQTAEIIEDNMKHFVAETSESLLLCELQFGLFEGRSPPEVQELFPQEFDHFKKAIDYGGRFWARPPLGESRFDVCLRVSTLIEEIKRKIMTSEWENIIIVSHGVTIRAFLMMWFCHTAEWFDDSDNPNNCCIQLIHSHTDMGYIFPGFPAPRHPKKSSFCWVTCSTTTPTK
eukprot:TRINITY_DN3812_c0_g2_i4.p1 TRINITY_DN3812_c0_g2~~TRINITY_DN3812_c0_g2_i4.p1  ORF type:complete len:309 (+),score=49.15 TRINITY_DN3812_c0_g2_i4:87-929(+)